MHGCKRIQAETVDQRWGDQVWSGEHDSRSCLIKTRAFFGSFELLMERRIRPLKVKGSRRVVHISWWHFELRLNWKPTPWSFSPFWSSSAPPRAGLTSSCNLRWPAVRAAAAESEPAWFSLLINQKALARRQPSSRPAAGWDGVEVEGGVYFKGPWNQFYWSIVLLFYFWNLNYFNLSHVLVLILKVICVPNYNCWFVAVYIDVTVLLPSRPGRSWKRDFNLTESFLSA